MITYTYYGGGASSKAAHVTMKNDSKQPVYFDYINLDDLDFDHYQRRVHEGKLKERVQNYHPKSMMPIAVSARMVYGKMHYFVYDGRQRTATLRRMYPDRHDIMVPCNIRTDMSQEDEAQALIDCNYHNVRFSKCALWATRYKSGEEFVIELTNLFRRHGFGIGCIAPDGKKCSENRNNATTYRGVGTVEDECKRLQKTHEMKEAAKIIGDTLDIIKGSFKGNKRTSRVLFLALTKFVEENLDNPHYDISSIVNVLSARSPEWFETKILTTEMDMHSCKSNRYHARCGADVIAKMMNKAMHIRSKNPFISLNHSLTI